MNYSLPLLCAGLLIMMGASCAGTYRPVAYNMPPIPANARYAVLSGIHVTSVKGVSKLELDEFDEAICSAIAKRGIRTDLFSDRPLLTVQLQRLNQESPAWHNTKRVMEVMGIPASLPGSTSNAIDVRLETWRQKRLFEHFAEFDTYQEKTPDWEALKTSVATRIADALYYAQ